VPLPPAGGEEPVIYDGDGLGGGADLEDASSVMGDSVDAAVGGEDSAEPFLVAGVGWA